MGIETALIAIATTLGASATTAGTIAAIGTPLIIGGAIAGGIAGTASLLSGSGSGQLALPAPGALPAAPTAEQSLLEAQEETTAKRRATILAGGATRITGGAGAPLLQSQTTKKTLLGE